MYKEKEKKLKAKPTSTSRFEDGRKVRGGNKNYTTMEATYPRPHRIVNTLDK